MPKTLINCPNCKKPIQAEIRHLFDVGDDPSAKQLLLSGNFNFVQCPLCGFRGNFATPIIYHDADKELLLSYVPPEAGLPQPEQEKIIGAQINQIMSKLPQEKRKGYLLQPQATLTSQGLVERILAADGITREMLQAQQQRLSIIQRLLTASEEVRSEIVKQEDPLIDGQFFGILDQLLQSAAMSNDQKTVQTLTDLQKNLMQTTKFGQGLSAQVKEVQAAVDELKKAGQNLTREQLLDIITNAPNETRLHALVSLTRPGIDYSFFQLLSERIDRARGDGRTRLIKLRDDLLTITEELDRQLEARLKKSRELLNKILQEKDIGETTLKYLPEIDEFFLQTLNSALAEAKKQKDKNQEDKLQQILITIEQASTASQVIAFLERLLAAPDDASRMKMLEENEAIITPEFLNGLASIVYQVQSGEDLQTIEQFKALHRLILRFSMRKNLNKPK